MSINWRNFKSIDIAKESYDSNKQNVIKMQLPAKFLMEKQKQNLVITQKLKQK